MTHFGQDISSSRLFPRLSETLGLLKWVGLGLFIRPFEKGCVVDIKSCPNITIEMLQLSHQEVNPGTLMMGYDDCRYRGVLSSTDST